MPFQRFTNNTMLLLLLTTFAMHPSVCVAQLNTTDSAEAACPGDTVDQLGPQIAKESRAFVASLKAATDANDRKAVSSMIRYPLAVHIGDRTFRAHTPEEFLNEYNRIINSTVQKAIDDPQSSKCLFFSPEGFMIGNGEVWFQKASDGAYKVFSINLGGRWPGH